MRAFVIDRFGEAGSLREVPDPVPGAGEILVRVRAAGVNPVDWKIRDGHQGERTFPLVLGIDFAGVVEGLGTGVTRFRVGDRVFGAARAHGAFTELTVLPVDAKEQPVTRIPDWLGDADAAALPIAGLTALAGLARLEPRAGDTLLLVGATGGVGAFAAQVAHGRGIRVIGTAHSGKEAFARSLGVERVIVYDREDVVAAVKGAAPDGVDAAFDLVSDRDGIKRLAEVVRPGGRVISAIRSVDEAWFAERNITASNLGMASTPQSSPAALDELVALIHAGTIRVHLQQTRSLDEAAAVLDELKSGQVSGKVVLRMAA